jgi:hypothetical protein
MLIPNSMKWAKKVQEKVIGKKLSKFSFFRILHFYDVFAYYFSEHYFQPIIKKLESA